VTHGSQQHRVWRFEPSTRGGPEADDVAREEPLEIRVNGRGVGVTMRTPGHDEELALGLLVSEGVLARPEDVARVRRGDRARGDMIDVSTVPGVEADPARLSRHLFSSSSCGVCGASTIDAVRRRCPAVAPGPRVPEALILGLVDALRSSQATFDRTGGLHAAGLFGPRGDLLAAREDIGRHNAVDKVVGHAFREGRLPLSQHLLLVSGRASFEVVQKAVAAGVPIVAAVSAPSSLAIDLAEEANVTLIGFLRPGRFNVYAHPERIGPQAGASPTATTL